MSGGLSVAAQAELMEKEKLVVEHQQRLESLRATIKSMASHQISLKQLKRRCEITVGELTRLQPDHVVYQGLGRAFVRVSVNRLIESNSEQIEKSEAEDNRLSNEKARASELAAKEEADLRKAAEEYTAAVQVLQALQAQGQQRVESR